MPLATASGAVEIRLGGMHWEEADAVRRQALEERELVAAGARVLHQVVACATERAGVNATLRAAMTNAMDREGFIAGYLPPDCVLATVTQLGADALTRVPGVWGVRELPKGLARLSVEAAHLASHLDAAGAIPPVWVKRASAPSAPAFSANASVPPNHILLEVALPPAASQADALAAARAAAATWAPRVSSELGCSSCALAARATPFGSAYVDVAAAPERASAVLRWLSERPAACVVSPHMADVQTQNYAASAIVQSGGMAASDATYARPLWDAGIDGSGEVVGCGDSGLDVNSCFFRDDRNNAAGPAHRKLAMYRAIADNRDDNGHGTHVAGSIAGSALGVTGASAQRYDGVAKGARIAFTDLGTGRDGSLITPVDLSGNYFEQAYRAGARIHSDSWGSSTLSYTSASREVDEFCWARQDFLPVFAAGNYGEFASAGRTITAPANAKCALAVGASLTESGPAPFVDATTHFFRVVGGMPRSGAGEVELYRAMAARFGPSWDGTLGGGTRLFVRTAAVLDACGGWNPPTGLPPGAKVVFLVERGTCTFTTKARNAQLAGGAAMLVYNNVEDGYFRMAAGTEDPANDVRIPSAAVPRAIGIALQAELAEATGADAVAIRTVSLDEAGAANLPRIDSMADFSSKGPALDGRLKPEVTAPGEMIVSARAGRTCGVTTMSGTSMATPVVSGALALLRQYFAKGWYASGGVEPTATGVDETQPSGALIRAAVINGASSMAGYTEAGFPLEPPPSFHQGFGRVNLAASVMLAQASASAPSDLRMQLQRGLRAKDRSSIVQRQQVDRYCFRVSRSGGSVAVTLAWHDPPSVLNARVNLVNDLDLTVQGPGISLPLPGRDDHINNVERVYIPQAPAGIYTIFVSATNLPDGPQQYALVARGDFDKAGVEAGLHDFQPGMLCGSGAPEEQKPAPSLLSGPPTLIGTNTATFHFEPSGGATIECRLQPQGATGVSNTSPMHDWRSCTSPEGYEGLPDGAYRFNVRDSSLFDASDSTASSRSFVVDTTKPLTRIIAPYPFEPTSADRTTSLDAIEIHFAASDATTVTSECAMAYSRNSAASAAAAVSGAAFSRCTTPFQMPNLREGYHVFAARSTDAAGNVESPPVTYAFRVTFPTPAPVFTTAPVEGAVNGDTVTFAFASADGTASLFECLLDVGDAISWEPCVSPKTYPDLVDGQYTMAVRIRAGINDAPNPAAKAEFYVDTVGPKVAYSRRPSTLVAGGLITFHFELDGLEYEPEAVKYTCVLEARGTPSNSRTFQLVKEDCKSPTTVMNLDSGMYAFSVRGTDKAGNTGASEVWEFTADDIPPSLEIATSTNKRTVNVSVEIGGDSETDPAVSGMCSLQRSENNALVGVPMQRSLELAGTTTSGALSFTELDDGRYVASCEVSDAAGNKAAMDAVTWVDNAPPRVYVEYDGTAGRLSSTHCTAANGKERPDGVSVAMMQPQERIDFRLRSVDASSGVASLQCTLAQWAKGALVPTWPENGGDGTSTTCDRDGTDGFQLECEAPCRVASLTNGTYWLLAAATDAAGIRSEPIACAFQVGSCESGCGDEEKAQKRDYVTFVAIGAAVVVFLLVAGVLIGRKVAAQRSARADQPRFEPVPEVSVELQAPRSSPPPLTCHICGWAAPNRATLELHLGEHAVLDGHTPNPTVAIQQTSQQISGPYASSAPVPALYAASAAIPNPYAARAPAPLQQAIKCPICAIEVATLGELNAHLDSAHSEPSPPSRRRTTPPRQGAHTRSLSDEVSDVSVLPRFESDLAPRTHGVLNAPSQARALRCPICGAYAPDARAMSMHMDEAHS